MRSREGGAHPVTNAVSHATSKPTHFTLLMDPSATRVLSLAPGLDLPIDAVTETTGILGNRGTGKTNTAKVYVEQLLDNGMQVVVIDPTDVWWGLKSSKDGKRAAYPVVICGGRKADVPLSAGDGATLADFIVETGASLVLSLRHLSQNDERRFVGQLCNRLYELKGKQDNPTPLAIVIDEASRLLPQMVRDPIAAVCVGAVQQLARQGRSSGFGIVVIDQRAATVNKEVLELVELMIVHRLTGPLNRKALKAWVDANADDDTRGTDFLRTLPTLKKGEVWVWSPSFLGVFASFSIFEAETFDSSYTPKVGEVRVTPKVAAIVELEVLKSKLATSIEKAKRDDPEQLRAEIAQLRTELDRAREITDSAASDADAALDRAIQREQDVARGIEIGEATERLKLRERLTTIGKTVKALADVLEQVDPLVDAVGVTLADALQACIVAGDEQTASQSPPIVASAASFLKPLDPAIEAAIRGERQRPPARETKQPRDFNAEPRPSIGVLEQIRCALAFFAQCGMKRPTRAAVAAYTQYHPRTSAFARALNALADNNEIERTEGFVVPRRSFKLAPDDVAKTQRQVQAKWLGKISGVEHDVVKLLLDKGDLPRARIASTLGYHPRTPTFARALKRLDTMGLVVAKDGHVTPTSLLYPEGMTP